MVPSIKRAFLSILAPLMLAAAAVPVAAEMIEPKLILTSKQNGFENTPEFSCSDTVHGYVTLPSRQMGVHMLEAVWLTPVGKLGEKTQVPLEFAPPGRQTAYVWLKFDDKKGGALTDLRPESKTADARASLNGTWQVQLLWDGAVLIQSNFKVRCS